MCDDEEIKAETTAADSPSSDNTSVLNSSSSFKKDADQDVTLALFVAIDTLENTAASVPVSTASPDFNTTIGPAQGVEGKAPTLLLRSLRFNDCPPPPPPPLPPILVLNEL